VNNPYAPPHSHVSRPLSFPIPVVVAPVARERADAFRGRRWAARGALAVIAVGLFVVLLVAGLRS